MAVGSGYPISGASVSGSLEKTTGQAFVNMAWLPTHPDILFRPPRPQAAHQDYFVENVSPITNPLPPNPLTWQPSYPDYLRPASRVAYLAPDFASNLLNLVPFYAWRPSHPDLIGHVRLPVAAYPYFFGDANLSAQPAIARYGWRPAHPDLMRAPARLPLGETVTPIQPSTIVGAATCVELKDVSLTSPTITGDTVTSPTFVNEALTQPDVTGESIC